MKLDGRFKKGMTPWNKGKKGYMGANKTSFKKGDNSIPLEIRFWEKVRKTVNCWIWTGSKNNKGYGRINIDRVVKLAHRVSFEMEYGKVDKKIMILHRCDNPACVNPQHLFTGTQKDNMRDMSKKKRGCNGENAPWAKLTWELVNLTRTIYGTGLISQRDLAKRIGVSQTVVHSIIHNKSWKI